MKIYIAFDFEDNPLSLILAKDKTYAEVAFTSMRLSHHNIEEIDPMAQSLDVGYVLTSEEIDDYQSNKKYRKWKRGL